MHRYKAYFQFLGVELDSLNIDISPGLYFKTQLRIFGYEIKAEVKFDQNAPSLYMDCEMSPLYWIGGLIVVQRSETNNQEGPKLYVDITTSKADVEIRGKANPFSLF